MSRPVLVFWLFPPRPRPGLRESDRSRFCPVVGDSLGVTGDVGCGFRRLFSPPCATSAVIAAAIDCPTSFIAAGLVSALTLLAGDVVAGLDVDGSGLLSEVTVLVATGVLEILNLLASISNIPERGGGTVAGGPINVGCLGLAGPLLRAGPPPTAFPFGFLEESLGVWVTAVRYPSVFFAGAPEYPGRWLVHLT